MKVQHLCLLVKPMFVLELNTGWSSLGYVMIWKPLLFQVTFPDYPKTVGMHTVLSITNWLRKVRRKLEVSGWDWLWICPPKGAPKMELHTLVCSNHFILIIWFLWLIWSASTLLLPGMNLALKSMYYGTWVNIWSLKKLSKTRVVW